MNISSIQNASANYNAAAEPAPLQPLSQDRRTLIQAVKAINASEMFGQENELTFSMDRAANRMVARIVNKNTREVLIQIPDEYVLRLAEEMNGD